MTTSVTVKTHDWPVAATVNTQHNFSDNQRQGYGYSTTTHFVPANSEQTFSISKGTNVTFVELEQGATGLPSNELPLVGNASSAG
jgi:hypothetical protein